MNPKDYISNNIKSIDLGPEEAVYHVREGMLSISLMDISHVALNKAQAKALRDWLIEVLKDDH